ncbi:solute carrier family 22 member 6-B-like [Sminthopsis crassicaudata]|uniref:solute carrier family 22 member 6-B-like n=1 Tax=Sminthopsis crassicaudata TaxID=9301 RepID=UPI003D68DBFA
MGSHCWTPSKRRKAVVPEHHCRIQNQTSAETLFLGDGRDRDLLKVSIPMDKAGKPERCLRFTGPQWQLLNPNATEQARLDTEGCLDGWVYDKSVFSSSIVTKWDLVCERKLLVPITQTVFVGGQLAGSIVFGILSDRFGRRTMLQWSSLLAAIADTAIAFVPTFAAYVIFRFFLGIALIGTNLTRFCLTVEWTPIEKQVLLHTCNMYVFTALPESARWLITHNKFLMALKALQKVAWINGHKEQGRTLTPEV